jgi:hypothetical protein
LIIDNDRQVRIGRGFSSSVSVSSGMVSSLEISGLVLKPTAHLSWNRTPTQEFEAAEFQQKQLDEFRESNPTSPAFLKGHPRF